MKSTNNEINMAIRNGQRPQQFVYYMTQLEGSPCLICVVQPMCKKSFLDDSACDELTKFITKITEEIYNENKN